MMFPGFLSLEPYVAMTTRPRGTTYYDDRNENLEEKDREGDLKIAGRGSFSFPSNEGPHLRNVDEGLKYYDQSP